MLCASTPGASSSNTASKQYLFLISFCVPGKSLQTHHHEARRSNLDAVQRKTALASHVRKAAVSRWMVQRARVTCVTATQNQVHHTTRSVVELPKIATHDFTLVRRYGSTETLTKTQFDHASTKDSEAGRPITNSHHERTELRAKQNHKELLAETNVVRSYRVAPPSSTFRRTTGINCYARPCTCRRCNLATVLSKARLDRTGDKDSETEK